MLRCARERQGSTSRTGLSIPLPHLAPFSIARKARRSVFCLRDHRFLAVLTFSPVRLALRRLALSTAACAFLHASDGSTAEGRTFAQQQRAGIADNARLPNLTLPDLAGTLQPLRHRPDEVTILNFWATWCVPCLKEIPELANLSHEFRARGLEVVGVAIDSGRPDDIRAFAVSHGMDYPLLVGTQRWAAEHFGVFGLPVTIVVDRSGRVRRRLIGPQTGSTFAAAVRPYL